MFIYKYISSQADFDELADNSESVLRVILSNNQNYAVIHTIRNFKKSEWKSDENLVKEILGPLKLFSDIRIKWTIFPKYI